MARTKSTIHQEQLRETLLRHGDFKYVPVQIWLKPIADHWQALHDVDDPGHALITKTIRDHPELLEPTDDVAVFSGHEDFLGTLFAPVFPRNGWTNAYQAVTPPFMNMPWIVATEKYSKLFNKEQAVFDLMNTQIGKKRVDVRLMYFYKAVFKKFYSVDLAVEEPVISSVLSKKDGLMRYFKLTGNTRFMDIVSLAPLPEIQAGTLQDLLDRPFDPVAWEEVLPMDNFMFRGVTFITLIDVTLEESATRLHLHLLNKNEDQEDVWFAAVQQEFRNLFKLPDLRIGIATLQRNGQLNTTSDRPLWNSLFGRAIIENAQTGTVDSIYQDLLKNGHTIVIEDLAEDEKYVHDKVVQEMISGGYRNLFLTPLMEDDNLLGILELLSSVPGAIHGFSLFKVNRLKPIFTNALKRHSEEFESRVKAVMLENFTAIHPSIEWKFRNAAIQIIENRDRTPIEENLCFHNLIPFYGSLDIRDSSRKRNHAILLDLQDNLLAAKELLAKGHSMLGLSVLDEHVYHIEKQLENVRSASSSAVEQNLAAFIRQKINPVIMHLKSRYRVMEDLAALYLEQVCSDSGIFTAHRRAYEQALALLNACIVQYLEKEARALEAQFPCYFDTYKTDGVEYNMYVGPDISPDRAYAPMDIESLQLQQLKWTCGIMRAVADLQPKIADLLSRVKDGSAGAAKDDYALHIAPLILVYSDPITLKFRMDEKLLDVDGSYNVRYEIVKKRIDKATIKDTGERLTQPGHVAIVYSRNADAAAYEKHLEYLAARKEVESGWEHFDLAPMPGTEGLKALRVKVV